MAKQGAPNKLTPELSAGLCKIIRKGLTLEDACALMGITTALANNWIRAGRAEKSGVNFDFLVATVAARSGLKEELVTRLLEADAGRRQWNASAWLLERLFPSEFAKRTYAVKDEKDGKELDLLIGLTEALTKLRDKRDQVEDEGEE